jgi:ethanolamine ammonia-lyase large subunit
MDLKFFQLVRDRTNKNCYLLKLLSIAQCRYSVGVPVDISYMTVAFHHHLLLYGSHMAGLKSNKNNKIKR